MVHRFKFQWKRSVQQFWSPSRLLRSFVRKEHWFAYNTTKLSFPILSLDHLEHPTAKVYVPCVAQSMTKGVRTLCNTAYDHQHYHEVNMNALWALSLCYFFPPKKRRCYNLSLVLYCLWNDCYYYHCCNLTGRKEEVADVTEIKMHLKGYEKNAYFNGTRWNNCTFFWGWGGLSLFQASYWTWFYKQWNKWNHSAFTWFDFGPENCMHDADMHLERAWHKEHNV